VAYNEHFYKDHYNDVSQTGQKQSGESMKVEKDEFLIVCGKSVVMTMRRRPLTDVPDLSCGNWKDTAVNSRDNFNINFNDV